MENFIPGKLYTTDCRYFFLVYPTQEKASRAFASASFFATASPNGADDAETAYRAAFWSGQLGCQVRWVKPGSRFMVVEAPEALSKESKRYLHVLFEDFDGWIIHLNWLQFQFQELLSK